MARTAEKRHGANGVLNTLGEACVRISPTLTIPDDEIELSFIRASGPGGQNVNKVATAVQLRYDAANSSSLPEGVRERLFKLAGSRLTSEGVLIIEAKRSRRQSRNRNQAISQFKSLLQQAERAPRRRIATRPSLAAKERRLRNKKQLSEKKQQRDAYDRFE